MTTAKTVSGATASSTVDETERSSPTAFVTSSLIVLSELRHVSRLGGSHTVIVASSSAATTSSEITFDPCEDGTAHRDTRGSLQHARRITDRLHLDETGFVERGGSSSEVAGRVELQLDHVLLAVSDLADAARVLHERYGLASVAGGRHTEWGTANRIIPVGNAYLELVAVVDHDRALANDFGCWVASARQGLVQPLGWAVRTASIGDVAQRLNLVVSSGSRATPDGQQLQWWLAGIETAAAESSHPFFIQWDRETPHPSQVTVTHPAGTVVVDRLEVCGDSTRLASWLGDHRLPVVISPGPSALERILLHSATRDIILEASIQ